MPAPLATISTNIAVTIMIRTIPQFLNDWKHALQSRNRIAFMPLPLNDNKCQVWVIIVLIRSSEMYNRYVLQYTRLKKKTNKTAIRCLWWVMVKWW